ncbi:hypothetical protein Bsph_0842 [Lysinibacillus sphaericus C3-41]|uniref:Uncharacterized protein n=1 Tax=Lysinibacillus sphaericus (strain C3-41) TaxID=444177 RepID=B1HZ58_LYSSC|nr:hypothetical protein Bsph_0842 [Lysinibacillus sphaericus C3-41]
MQRVNICSNLIEKLKKRIVKGMKTISFARLGKTNVLPRKIFLV